MGAVMMEWNARHSLIQEFESQATRTHKGRETDSIQRQIRCVANGWNGITKVEEWVKLYTSKYSISRNDKEYISMKRIYNINVNYSLWIAMCMWCYTRKILWCLSPCGERKRQPRPVTPNRRRPNANRISVWVFRFSSGQHTFWPTIQPYRCWPRPRCAHVAPIWVAGRSIYIHSYIYIEA